MGFFSKPKPIITDEDNKELLELQRQAYMNEARKIIAERGKKKAQEDLGVKEKKEGLF